jgi:peptidyl-tRNA hydrolase, PTH1 family
MDNLFLIVGLGNPGAEYEETRHNAGFMAVDLLGARHGIRWVPEARLRARIAQGQLGLKRYMAAQPQTFMNLSGIAVASIATFYKVPPERVLVVVDDADLPLGQIRLRPSGSSGGHHGLESVEKHLGSRGYPRLRIGIGRRESPVREIAGHVLGRFVPAEKALLEKVMIRVVDQIECWLTDGIELAMNRFNGAVNAPMAKES